MKVTLYTDPGCPFGFNAQRQELQLMWHYGDAANIERRMIVLSERTASYEERGMSPEMIARGRERLLAQYGMPMGLDAVTEAPATIDACRAYVGARMHAPDRSLALAYKLSKSDGGLRYSTSSAVFESDGRRRRVARTHVAPGEPVGLGERLRQRVARGHGGRVDRLAPVEPLLVGVRAPAQGAQERQRPVRRVHARADVRPAGVDRRGRLRRGLGAHRHPVRRRQPLAAAGDHVGRHPALLERDGLLGQDDHAPLDLRRMAVVPHELELLALGVEAERAAGVGVERDLHRPDLSPVTEIASSWRQRIGAAWESSGPSVALGRRLGGHPGAHPPCPLDGSPAAHPPDDRCRRPWRLRRSGRCPRERRLVSSNVGAARCEPPLGRSAQPDPPRSFAAAVTHLLYGVPVWPGTCFLLSFAQARAGLPVSPVASLAIAVTHWLNGVPC